MSRTCWVLCALVAPAALAAESPTLARAIEDFHRGKFDQVRDQLERLRSSPALSEADQAELVTYLAATHHALGDVDRAHEELVALFRRFPAAKLDPALFVPALVELGERARAAAASEPSASAPRRLPADAPQVAAPADLTPRASAPPDLTPRAAAPPLAVSAIPFGVGHFVGGRPVRGVSFLTAELTLLVTSLVTLGMLEDLKVEGDVLQGGRVPFGDLERARALNVVSFASFWAAVAVAGFDVFDSLRARSAAAPAQPSEAAQ